MIKHQLEEDLKKAVKDLGFGATDVVLSIPKNLGFGDYSSNIALQLAKQKSAISRQSSVEIAKQIVDRLQVTGDSKEYLAKTEIKGGGFINFFIRPEFLVKDLEETLEKGENFGSSSNETGEKIQVEFISANPTGPLTLANGRGGALGDTLSNVLAFSGDEVNRQYYVNDTGNQIRLLGESALAIAGKVPQKDEHYKGEYVKELAEKFNDKLDLEPQELGHIMADYLLENEIKPAIERLGVRFDEFYSERSLYEKDLVSKAVKLLKEKDLAYEKDGALWFKATQFGDEKDRVLMTSQAGRGREEPTYFLADIAHYLDDLQKHDGRRINILGADHHSYGVRMQGVMEALGYKGRTEIILFQFVRLFKEGKEVRMSKRAGNFVTLDELL
ncbi:MAG: arginine--tRNA ligase, partial [Candidatus Daviesbacteria bacterium]|nr:arginine--tRNA ligase [Candidatus Daviesbacteria bacterium]